MSQYHTPNKQEEMHSSPPTSPVAAFIELRRWLARANQARATLGLPTLEIQLTPAMSMDDMLKVWEAVRKGLSTTDRQAQQASAAQAVQAEIAKFKTRLYEVTGFAVEEEDVDTEDARKVSPPQIDSFMQQLRNRHKSLDQMVQDARLSEMEELRAQAAAALSLAGRPTTYADEATVGRLKNIIRSPEKYGREEGGQGEAAPRRFAGHDDLCFAGTAKKDGAGPGKDRVYGVNLEVTQEFIDEVVNPLLRREVPQHCGLELRFWRRDESTVKILEEDLRALKPGQVVQFRAFLHTYPDGNRVYHCELGPAFGNGQSKGKFVLLKDHPEGWLMEAVTDSYSTLPSRRDSALYEAAPRSPRSPLDVPPRQHDQDDRRQSSQGNRRPFTPQRRSGSR